MFRGSRMFKLVLVVLLLSDDTSLSEHSSRISSTVFRILHPYFGALLFPVYPAACAAGCSLLTCNNDCTKHTAYDVVALGLRPSSPIAKLSYRLTSQVRPSPRQLPAHLGSTVNTSGPECGCPAATGSGCDQIMTAPSPHCTSSAISRDRRSSAISVCTKGWAATLKRHCCSRRCLDGCRQNYFT